MDVLEANEHTMRPMVVMTPHVMTQTLGLKLLTKPPDVKPVCIGEIKQA